GREEDMQPRLRCRLQGFDRRVNVLPFRARQGCDRRVADFASHSLHSFQISSRGNWKAGFDDVYTEFREMARHADLLRGVHREAGRLLAIAQRGVENADWIHASLRLSVRQIGALRVQFIFILVLIILLYTQPWT